MRRIAAIIGGTLALTVLVVPAAHAAPKNDLFTDAVDISAVPFHANVSTIDATLESGEPRPCGAIGSTVWYVYRPTVDVTVTADTAGSTFDTVLTAYSGTSLNALTRLGCSDDAGGLTSRVSFTARAGGTYYLQAGGYQESGGLLEIGVVASGSIAGVVVASNGEGLADVCVDVYGLDGERRKTAFTNQTGVYRVSSLPAGEYKIRFSDCGDRGEPGGEPLYSTEWWDDQRSFSSADPVAVEGGTVTAGIDALLSPRPRPDLSITDLTLEDVNLRTSAGEIPVGTGWSRDVTVEVANIGTAKPSYALLRVSACPASIGSCHPIGKARVSPAPGAATRKTFRWNAAGSVGDFRLSIQVETSVDSDWENNFVETDEFFFVGGTGVGATPEGAFGDRTCVYYPVYTCVPL